MATPAQTPTLAQAIKAKYPDYADIPDAELEGRVLAKYPQYADYPRTSTSTPQQGRAQLVQAMAQQAAPKFQGANVAGAPQSALGRLYNDFAQSAGTYKDIASNLFGAATQAGEYAVNPLGAPVRQAAQVGASIDPNAPKTSVAAALAGVNRQGIQQAISESDPAAFVRQAAAPIGTGVVASKLLSGATQSEPISRQQAVDNIVNAVNPPAKQMPGMRKALTQHLDTIASTAGDEGVTGRGALANTVLKAASDAHDQFQSMLQPMANERVNVNAASGGPANYQPLGKLYARLVEINNTLDPKYMKGGTVGQAAVGSEQAAALRAEGAQIRSVLYSEMAKRLNTTPDAVAAVNQKAGALRKLAEQIQLSADKVQYGKNAAAQRPPDVEMTFTGAMSKAANKLRNLVVGDVGDNAIKDALMRYR